MMREHPCSRQRRLNREVKEQRTLQRAKARIRLLRLPKVGQLRLGKPPRVPRARERQHDVLELDVAVGDAERVVEVLERERELEEEPLGFGGVEAAVLDQVGEEVATGDAVAHEKMSRSLCKKERMGRQTARGRCGCVGQRR